MPEEKTVQQRTSLARVIQRLDNLAAHPSDDPYTRLHKAILLFLAAVGVELAPFAALAYRLAGASAGAWILASYAAMIPAITFEPNVE